LKFLKLPILLVEGLPYSKGSKEKNSLGSPLQLKFLKLPILLVEGLPYSKGSKEKNSLGSPLQLKFLKLPILLVEGLPYSKGSKEKNSLGSPLQLKMATDRASEAWWGFGPTMMDKSNISSPLLLSVPDTKCYKYVQPL